MAQTPPMAPQGKPSAAEDKMKTVKAAWDKAPSGPKKDAECIRELDAAAHALV